MFGLRQNFIILTAMFSLGTLSTSCSDGAFDGGAGSFSGNSSTKASKIVEKDDTPEYICIRVGKNESLSENMKKAEKDKALYQDRKKGEECDQGLEEAVRNGDGSITEAIDDGKGGLDGGNDCGSVDGGLDGGKGSGDDDDDDDDGIDWDDPDSAKLREPMKITQTEGDEKASVRITFITKKGNGEEVKVDFKENEKTSKDAPNICAKKGTTTVKIIISSKDGDKTAGQREDMKWTRTGKNGVKVHTDLDGCGFMGQCLDVGKDNGYVFECEHSKVKVEGIGI